MKKEGERGGTMLGGGERGERRWLESEREEKMKGAGVRKLKERREAGM